MKHNEEGFLAVEFLVTLVVASIFLAAFIQAYTTATKSLAEAREDVLCAKPSNWICFVLSFTRLFGQNLNSLTYPVARFSA